jgi:hypothetical protein
MKYRVIAVNEKVTDRPEDWGKLAGFCCEGVDVNEALSDDERSILETILSRIAGMKVTIQTV